jgi:hypothetical protein
MDIDIKKKAKILSSKIIDELHSKKCFKCGLTTSEKVFSTVLINKNKTPSFKIVSVCHYCFIDTKYTF